MYINILFQTEECIERTNEKCTPFTYKGVNYDKCEFDRRIGYWCVGKHQSGLEISNCGVCAVQDGDITNSTSLFVI